MFTFYRGLSDVIYISLESASGGSLQSNPTLASGDVTISKDGGSFANLATLPDVEPNSSKSVRIYLSSSETSCNNGVIIFEDAAGNEWLPAVIPFITKPSFDIERQNTAQAGASTTITLDASANATDDYYNGMTIRIISGLGEGQENTITDYVGSTKVATVSAWGTNPDNTSVFRIYKLGVDSNVTRWKGSTVATVDTAGYPKVTIKSGTGTGELSLASGEVVVSTNNDKTGYTASASNLNDIADAILKRSFSSVTGESSRSLLNAARKLMNKISISGSTLTVHKEDDSTSAYTQTVNTDSTLEPISSLDTN